MLRQWFMRSSMRSSKPGAKNDGSRAMKAWPKSASLSVCIHRLTLGPYCPPVPETFKANNWRADSYKWCCSDSWIRKVRSTIIFMYVLPKRTLTRGFGNSLILLLYHEPPKNPNLIWLTSFLDLVIAWPFFRTMKLKEQLLESDWSPFRLSKQLMWDKCLWLPSTKQCQLTRHYSTEDLHQHPEPIALVARVKLCSTKRHESSLHALSCISSGLPLAVQGPTLGDGILLPAFYFNLRNKVKIFLTFQCNLYSH